MNAAGIFKKGPFHFTSQEGTLHKVNLKKPTSFLIESCEYIHQPFFPEGIHVALCNLPDNDRRNQQAVDRVESEWGKDLLKEIIKKQYGKGDPVFTTIKYEKPSAILKKDILSISFSHTSDKVCGVVSDRWVVGIDMESSERTVHDRLAKRMKHSSENLKLYKKDPIIKIWTMKEAALKAIGTGLRKPMNSVKLESITDELYEVEFFNGIRANICSFQVKRQWISICYISSKISESFLSKVYVPIQT